LPHENTLKKADKADKGQKRTIIYTGEDFYKVL